MKRFFGRGKAAMRSDGPAAALFLAPAMIGYVMFIALPIVLVFYLAFTKYTLIRAPQWTGLANWQRFFTDPTIGPAFLHTLKFVVILVPLHLVMGLVIAYGIYCIRNSRLRNLFRGIIYFPSIVTAASVAIVFSAMFSTNSGFINYYLSQWGASPIPWLTDENWVYVTLAIFSFWKTIGQTFLYYFVGLCGIPESYYEAARIDGASTVTQFFRITLPLLTPTIFFVLITTSIGVFQIFDEPYFITQGGPGEATVTIGLKIYRIAFKDMNYGFGSTVAVVLFLVIMLITVIQFIGQKKWVVYDYE